MNSGPTTAPPRFGFWADLEGLRHGHLIRNQDETDGCESCYIAGIMKREPWLLQHVGCCWCWSGRALMRKSMLCMVHGGGPHEMQMSTEFLVSGRKDELIRRVTARRAAASSEARLRSTRYIHHFHHSLLIAHRILLSRLLIAPDSGKQSTTSGRRPRRLLPSPASTRCTFVVY